MSNFRTGTPLQEFELPFNYEEYGKDILITYSQNNRVIIEKQRDDIRIEKNIITFTLRQEETKSFCAGVIALQIKVLDYTDNVIISDIFYTNLKEVLSGKLFVISESKLEELTATENGEYYPSENKVGFSKVTVQVADTNGSYDEGYAQGKLDGGQALVKYIENDGDINLTAQDLIGTTKIGASAFAYNYKLKSIEMPNSVKSIGEASFSDCSNLQNVSVGNNLEIIGGYAFQNCRNLKNITFPNTLTNIKGNAFTTCRSITSIELPDSVTYIGSAAFYNMENLKNVRLSNKISYIFMQTFDMCVSLTELTIPASVIEIGYGALYIGSPENKGTITFLSTTPPTISSGTFDKNRLNKIIVPKGSRATYIASTNWSNYADYIVESEV